MSSNCIDEAVKCKVKRYIEFSDVMCSNGKKAQFEDSAYEPFTPISKNKMLVEKKLHGLDNFNYTILRLPLVYGKGIDKKGLTRQIVISSIYKHLKEPMQLLWESELKLNTIHVDDVAGITLKLMDNPVANKMTINLVDDSGSTQGSITNILCDIFHIRFSFLGTLQSKFAALSLQETVDDINDKHMTEWAKICQLNNIPNTLSPYLAVHDIDCKHLHLSNNKLKSLLAYDFIVPIIDRKYIEEIIDELIETNIFPRSLKI